MINEILKYDASFSESKFITFVNNVFVKIYIAVMLKELESIKHFVNDEIYSELEQKVSWLNEKKFIQMYDEINVKQTTLLNYSIKENMLEIEVNTTSRYMDYLMDENGNFVSGNNQYRIEKENHLTFQKKIEVHDGNGVHKCPGCGASIDVNANGLCSYCGTTYNLEEKGWILISLKVI